VARPGRLGAITPAEASTQRAQESTFGEYQRGAEMRVSSTAAGFYSYFHNCRSPVWGSEQSTCQLFSHRGYPMIVRYINFQTVVIFWLVWYENHGQKVQKSWHRQIKQEA